MASRKAAQIEHALLSKGFRYDNTHHRYLILYVAGGKTLIRTHLSHSDPEYGDGLLQKMKRQLHLSNTQGLLDLIDCPLSQDGYVALLREQGLV